MAAPPMSAIDPNFRASSNSPTRPMNADMQQNMHGVPTQLRSGTSVVSDHLPSANNITLVAGAHDTNSTLVADGPPASVRSKIATGQPIPIITLTPDNKKFPAIDRPVTGILKIGRFVGNQPQSEDMITFRSKVISRNHAEIWAVNGELYIRDTRSQSGTFLNAMRLSEPSKESKPYRLKSGDVIQFGVDYKGATEGMYLFFYYCSIKLFVN
jgi:hypothetical protein